MSGNNYVAIGQYRDRIGMIPGGRRNLVLDTSILRTYGADTLSLFSDNPVYIPDSVLEEVRDDALRERFHLSRVHAGAFEYDGIVYREDAMRFLEQSDKALTYESLAPFLREFVGRGINSEVLCKGLRRMKGDNHLFEEGRLVACVLESYQRQTEPGFRGRVEDILTYLERRCAVSEADKDVLALAMFLAETTDRVSIVGECDSHLRDGIEMLWKEKEGCRVFYAEPYIRYNGRAPAYPRNSFHR